jgi:hypothetical protein
MVSLDPYPDFPHMVGETYWPVFIMQEIAKGPIHEKNEKHEPVPNSQGLLRLPG